MCYHQVSLQCVIIRISLRCVVVAVSCFYCCFLCLAVVFVCLHSALDSCRGFAKSLHSGGCCLQMALVYIYSHKKFQVGSLKND